MKEWRRAERKRSSRKMGGNGGKRENEESRVGKGEGKEKGEKEECNNKSLGKRSIKN